ncbi:hypothetical protein BV898_15180 [Hypsibius exemplaris]|uniref:Uncharacterized protein n=1 Tax=Hypsibius exemplaris TaxID=2072580 RepID=A0A9X6NA25_HYPEX|nr:hypothetical protein BV898_15180 [Hypsibius exemplaris]
MDQKYGEAPPAYNTGAYPYGQQPQFQPLPTMPGPSGHQMYAPQQQQYNPYPQQGTTVVHVVPSHDAHHHHHTQTIIVEDRGVNHCLHFCISLFFFPWLFVWLFLCITDGC